MRFLFNIFHKLLQKQADKHWSRQDFKYDFEAQIDLITPCINAIGNAFQSDEDLSIGVLVLKYP